MNRPKLPVKNNESMWIKKYLDGDESILKLMKKDVLCPT